MPCFCCIVPNDVLERLARELGLPEELRRDSENTARISTEIRNLRVQHTALTSATSLADASLAPLSIFPEVTVYDSQKRQTLPGILVLDPGSSTTDPTAVRTYQETTAVAQFYKEVFNRNSVDDAGMSLMSSIHYGINYNNAMWTGSQMVYGDGDNSIFVDFTKANDVIGHELTHGVTQFTLQLEYQGDAGGLNESLSDCFGSMFRQWQANQDVNAADWLIGHDIIGPAAVARGYTCLRDMANPAASHCLSRQPTKYSDIPPGADPHISSGPPNLAFCLACKAVGGKSWEKVGQIWYRALTGFGPSPHMKMKTFADRTRKLTGQMYGSDPVVVTSVDDAWKSVGL